MSQESERAKEQRQQRRGNETPTRTAQKQGEGPQAGRRRPGAGTHAQPPTSRKERQQRAGSTVEPTSKPRDRQGPKGSRKAERGKWPAAQNQRKNVFMCLNLPQTCTRASRTLSGISIITLCSRVCSDVIYQSEVRQENKVKNAILIKIISYSMRRKLEERIS